MHTTGNAEQLSNARCHFHPIHLLLPQHSLPLCPLTPHWQSLQKQSAFTLSAVECKQNLIWCFMYDSILFDSMFHIPYPFIRFWRCINRKLIQCRQRWVEEVVLHPYVPSHTTCDIRERLIGFYVCMDYVDSGHFILSSDDDDCICSTVHLNRVFCLFQFLQWIYMSVHMISWKFSEKTWREWKSENEKHFSDNPFYRL